MVQLLEKAGGFQLRQFLGSTDDEVRKNIQMVVKLMEKLYYGQDVDPREIFES